MLSIYNLALNITAVKIVFIVGHRVIANTLGSKSSKIKEFKEIGSKDHLERHSKASIKLPKAFSGDISD